MGNMSYCRFQNTLEDLKDCFENWELEERDDEEYLPATHEIRARAKLLKLCQKIVNCFSEEEED